MSEWKEYKFSDIARFVSDKIDISLISEEEYISTDNMLPNFGGVCFAEKLPQSPRCNSFLENDILFSNIRTYFKKIWLATFDGGCSADVLVIRSKNQHIVLQQYLYLLICSPDFINFTITSSNGAKMPRGDKKAILNYTFLIPPINYQKLAINHYLLFNNKIQLNTETNQTLEAIAQAIFKHWFIDFAPVHAKADALAAGKTAEQAELAAMTSISGKTEAEIIKLANSDPQAYQQLQQTAAAFPSEFVESEMGLVPKGWEVQYVRNIIKFIKGKKPKELFDKTGDELMPYITMATVSGKNYSFAKKEKMIVSNKMDILMSMDGSAGNIFIGFEGVVGSTFSKIEILNNKHRFYFYHFIKDKEEDIKANTTGTSVPHTDKDRVLDYPIIIPDNLTLSKFSEISKNHIELSLILKSSNQELEKTRNILLPKLLNGEIEL